MAPSRRRSANKAAAAAAARQKWKLGDLVLAKLKGFPAWPAMVTDPESLGYTADWKKVVVKFFGCSQIAYCNPADVEEFTEEKKASLLGKRHGKGADFVRAVKEIIDCFEKLKNQDQVSRANGADGNNITNENTEESLTESVKDEDLVDTVKPLSGGTDNNLNSLTEAAIAAAAEDDLHGSENLVSTVTPASTTYIERNKSEVARSRKCGSQRRKSARVLRSSSRIDANKLQSTMLSSTIKTRRSRRSSTNVSEDRSLRRSKRIVRSSDGEDANSLAFVSNESIEDSDSEIMTVDSDTLSINGGTTIDSGSKPVESFTGNNDVETILSDMLDFQSNKVIIKKKRKPNRKRHNSDTLEAAKYDNVVASDAEMLKTECVSPTFSEQSAHRCGKDDGDEHLPLVKRARVRMGRPSPAEEEEVNLMHEEEKVFDVPKEDPVISCPSLVSPVRRPTLSETRKNFVDEEAALPPSKRLHRALEAMSANVAEDCERASNCSPAAFMERSELPLGQEAVVELESGASEDLRNGDSSMNASEFCVMSNIGTPENDSETVIAVSDCIETHGNNSTDAEFFRDSFEHAEGADSKRLKLSSPNEVPAEIDTEQPVNLEREHSILANCKCEHSELNEDAEKPDNDLSQMNSVPNCVEEIAAVTPNNNDTCIRIESADAEGDETHKKKHIVLTENDQNNKRTEIVEELCPASLDSNIILSITPAKISNGGHHVDDRTVSMNQSSSSLTDGPDSAARASPPCSSICNISALDNYNSRENNSASSPDVHLHLEKAKLAGRSSGKRESLSSFEAMIKSLTRTKESIGRATRIAIDCAKLGFATKVVETLARNLESESSSRKKVDLFFLVDSITQCSRGMKGDGGVYPSAIQAFLPRLLLAAAPPSSGSHENHRQCLKVLRVWQERKILPEPIIRHHIRELDALCGSAYPIVGSQRPLRNERAFDDPIREMEGMLVDEYGSNSSIQLPGFCMPRMLKDDEGGSDSDGESFEAVTPEHNNNNVDGEKNNVISSTVEKRSHILEDVDGELEMEDVAPPYCQVEITTTSTMPNHQSDNNHYWAPQNPQKDQAPTYAPPISRSPLPPPPPPPLHPPAGSAFPQGVHSSVSNAPESKPYSSCQNFNRNFQDNQLPRVKPTDGVHHHHRVRENKDFEAQVPREMHSDRHFSNRAASNGAPRNDPFGKGGFHLRPPHPAPSDQFSYVQEQRRRDIPPPSHSNRFQSRNAENANFYRDHRARNNKFVPRDNIGECWRPPFQSISGPCYPDDGRMAHAPPMSYNGPPREPAVFNNRWDFPPRPMNHRHFNYRPPSHDPVSISNRGPNFWRPR